MKTFFLSYCINKNDFLLFQAEYVHIKEIVERRHGEPIKFLFLPKMGLLGSQASTEKKIGWEF